MFNKWLSAILMLLAWSCTPARAADEGKLMSDLETQTAIAQRRLGLLQAQAAITAFNGTGGQPLPQIVSLYSAAGKLRALVDMGAAGIREVGAGDTLTETLVVTKIDAQRGVEVRVVGGSRNSNASLHLAMKSAPPASSGSAPNAAGTPPVLAPGYPLVPTGLSVPPLQPMQASATPR